MRTSQLIECWESIPKDELSGYVYSLGTVTENWINLKTAIPERSRIYYSLKANPSGTIVRHLNELGAYMDVCSMGELKTVLDQGVDPTQISYLGPGKTDFELIACVENRVGIVVVESINELTRLSAICRSRSTPIEAILRVNMEEPSRNNRLAMGGKPRQFGIDEERLLETSTHDLDDQYVKIIGFHSYSGTRNLDASSIVETTRNTLSTFHNLSAVLGVEIQVANVGGGFGVPYHDGEEKLDIDLLASGLDSVIGEFTKTHKEVTVCFESGRFLAASSGTFITQIVDYKISRGHRFLVCAGGTNHFYSAAGAGSIMRRNFPSTVIDCSSGQEVRGGVGRFDVSGPLCTPNDLLLRDVELPEPSIGDYIAINMAGAYGYSASMVDFLSHGHPFEYFINDK